MLNDFRFAIRQLWKSPGFTLAAVTVLALGIGVNTAIFTLVNQMLFQPPAYSRPNEIVQLFSQDANNPKSFRSFSYPIYRDIREQNTVFAGLLAHDDTLVGLGEKGNIRRGLADLVSSNFFSVLGVRPIRGRTFLPDEEKPGRNQQVAIVSYRYWQQEKRDPALLGGALIINGHAFTVVGIMPEGFSGTSGLVSPSVWLPLGVYDEIMSARGGGAEKPLAERGSDRLLLVGRLKSGLTAATAAPALTGLATNLRAAYPLEQKDQTFMTAPLDRFSTSSDPSDAGPIPLIGALLMAMAGVVLLVACLNLANMLLARGTARRKEIAIRLALGASRGRIVRQLLTEGFVLALLGGFGGLLLGLWSSDLLVAALGQTVSIDIVWVGGPNLPILAATLLFCVLGTFVFSLGPALKLSRGAVLGDLKQQAGEDVVRRRGRFLPRNPLVVAQIAFSLALVTAAVLFIRGASKAGAVESGLHAEHTFLVGVDASLRGFEPKRARELYRTLGEKFAALPGVAHASISATVPFGDRFVMRAVQRAGVVPDSKAEPIGPFWNSVGADYFASAGLPLLRGRPFTEAEATEPGGPPVAIIDEVLAQKLWPNENALGQHLQFPIRNDAPPEKFEPGSGQITRGQPIEIVGIVPPINNRLFDRRPAGTIFLPFARGFQSDVFFFVRFTALPEKSEAAAADVLRRTVQGVDPVLPILELRTYAKHLNENPHLWIVRTGAAMFTVFGALALALAVVGIYGVKAYAVARRTREIGIRMALGARRRTVLWMMLREGLTMIAAGLLIGLFLAIGTGKIISSILFQVSPLDPFAFTLAPALLALAALLATWLPARRATRINPMEALRSE
ncbi:MAG: ABC transporter permease [Chthoniobacterales bacterium]